MIFTPLVTALLIGSFWTGVGVTAATHSGNLLDPVDTSINVSVDEDHIAACHARYRSYDEGRDMYIASRDGKWHLCRL